MYANDKISLRFFVTVVGTKQVFLKMPPRDRRIRPLVSKAGNSTIEGSTIGRDSSHRNGPLRMHSLVGVGARLRLIFRLIFRLLASNANQYATLLLMIFALAGQSFAAVANNTAPADTHLYFFTNHGCAPCRQVEPGIVALAQEGYPVTTIIVSEQPAWAEQFQVDRTPTVIMVSGNKVVGRHAGLIDGVTLKKWFAEVGMPTGTRFADQKGGTKVSLDQTQHASPTDFTNRFGSPKRSFQGTSTVHKGTSQPSNPAERRALAATVRLKVEDPEGISYATGTVIHCHGGEWLVMTCGHVFRESKGTGQITVEYNFADGNVKSAAGELISYDAEARDIGLVAVRAGVNIEPVAVADKDADPDRGTPVFSIGCDQGDRPTIRHSEIKNRAAYDGAIKYDIYGRPVNGRSGGGLFHEDGSLIGVCNAAAVEEDEGIYTALETVYWQIAEVNLEHLFEAPAIADASLATAAPERPRRFQPIQRPENAAANSDLMASDAKPERPLQLASSVNDTSHPLNPVRWDDAPATKQAASIPDSDSEVIIIVRSKSDPSRAEAITVSQPSDQLLQYLSTMQDSAVRPREMDEARLRKR